MTGMSEMDSGDNTIKVMKIRREGFTEYRIDVRSAFAVPYFESHIQDEYIAATLANQIREFVNASVLGECIEIEYRKLGDSWTCPYCGAKVVSE